jgi:hypothetical protein
MDMNNMTKSQLIAQTIYQQIGGNQFAVMTGSKHFFCGERENGNVFLQMQLSKNKTEARWLIIILNGLDYYDMEFVCEHNGARKIVKEYNSVDFEQLQPIFESVTGLYTKL